MILLISRMLDSEGSCRIMGMNYLTQGLNDNSHLKTARLIGLMRNYGHELLNSRTFMSTKSTANATATSVLSQLTATQRGTTSENSALPCFNNVYVENLNTLVDPIDDQIDSSRKVNLCPPSVDACALNDSSLSSAIGVDQLVCNNPLFDVDITNDGEMHSGVSWHDRIVIPLEGYQIVVASLCLLLLPPTRCYYRPLRCCCHPHAATTALYVAADRGGVGMGWRRDLLLIEAVPVGMVARPATASN
ncbi:hypothetical protein MTR67_002776 [Solanum verrucosum]|uniref:Uncharacterized protein n=1 Tax=Solanum verrucosum TaxID=315347 RepID=A0AAF0PRH9_SOLVR|nr:hypothetical protein MTR67_002776 [Solanum verrucosum]